MELIGPSFATIHNGQPLPERTVPQVQPKNQTHKRRLEQVHLCLTAPGISITDPRRFAFSLLNAILGGNMSSRLFQEIREKRGLAYNVFSFVSSYIDAGMLGIYVATDPKEVNRALKVIKKEIRKIQKGDVSKADLEETLEHLTGGILLGSENTDTRMIRLAKNEGIFGRYISYEEVVADLQKVTVDQVVEVARQAFEKDSVSLVTLGPLEKEKLDLGNVRFG